MACNPLTNLVKQCGRKMSSGLRDEVYLVPFDALKNVTGSTEVYTTSVGGLISKIEFLVPAEKFVKYGAIRKSNAIKETFSLNDNGSYNINHELTFSLSDMGSVATKKAVEDLFGNPVAVLVKMRSGSWLAFGLNGSFQMTAAAGEIADAANQRAITLSGDSEELAMIVDPTIVATLIA
jgi:hypothetical protein